MSDDTQEPDPGLEKLEDGTIIIGDAAARASLKRAEKEAFEHAQGVVAEINAETEKVGDAPDFQP